MREMSLQELIEQAELLTSSLLLHLHESSSRTPLLNTQNPAPVKEAAPPPPPPPQVKKEAPPPPPPPPAPPVIPSLHAPFMQLLSREYVSPPRPSFDLKGFHVPVRTEPLKDAAPPAWQNLYPQCLFISFFPENSEEGRFLKKVEEAVSTRLQRRATLAHASLETASDLSAFASSQVLKACILVIDPSYKAKMQEWLTLLSLLEEEKKEIGPLQLGFSLFSCPCYTLELPRDFAHSAEFKASLWKSLQCLM